MTCPRLLKNAFSQPPRQPTTSRSEQVYSLVCYMGLSEGLHGYLCLGQYECWYCISLCMKLWVANFECIL